ncbi:MAG: CAP domain-containing protein [Chitinophagaceae bacterium]
MNIFSDICQNSGGMFHVKHIIFCSVLIIQGSLCQSQAYFTIEDKPFMYDATIQTQVQSWLDRFQDYKLLNEEQRQMIYWVNVLRSNPKRFQQVYIDSFLRQYPKLNLPEAKTLKNILFDLDPLPLLAPSLQYSRISQKQADHLQSELVISHNDHRGHDFPERMRMEGVQCAAENIASVKGNALVAVIVLLLDINLPGAGHRVNLLSQKYQSLGVGVAQSGLNENIIYSQLFSCNKFN